MKFLNGEMLNLGFSALIIHNVDQADSNVLTAVTTPTHWPLAPSLHVVSISDKAAASLRINYTFLSGKSKLLGVGCYRVKQLGFVCFSLKEISLRCIIGQRLGVVVCRTSPNCGNSMII